MTNKPHDTRQGGVHIDYIISLLETCRSSKQQWEVRLLCYMRLKKTILKMLRWGVNTGLLKRVAKGQDVYYTTTMKGRKLQDTLERYEKA